MGDQVFAAWLRRQLERREWNAAELARRMAISPARVSEWLSGKYVPNPASCLRLADTLDVEPDDVLAVAGHRVTSGPMTDEGRKVLIGMVNRVNLTPDRVAALEATLRAWLELDRAGKNASGRSGV